MSALGLIKREAEIKTEHGQNSECKDLVLFVVIHLGARNAPGSPTHSRFASSTCRDILKHEASVDVHKCTDPICWPRIPELYTQSAAEHAVIQAIEKMEDFWDLNCGRGSELNLQGKVECDASIMRSQDCAFAGVGAIMGCYNPIRLAESLLIHRACPRPLGLMQPNILVGSAGGKKWMLKHCPSLLVPDSMLINDTALDRYQNFKSRFDESRRQKPSIEQLSAIQNKMGCDTVGAITVDSRGHMACATSSGGIPLKDSGRLGQAALPGAGCWAQGAIAVTTTGVGELLTLNLFAKKIYDSLEPLIELKHDITENIDAAVRSCFFNLINSPISSHLQLAQKYAGALAVIVIGKVIYFVSAHNTTSMIVGYDSYHKKNQKQPENYSDPSGTFDRAEENTDLDPNLIRVQTRRLYINELTSS